MESPAATRMPSPLTDPAQLRVDYRRAALDEQGVDPDPFRQFARWFDEAVAAAVPEPNAMTVASADATGRPAARILLLKGVDERGFVFYTNYGSRKGRELAPGGYAALLFFWVELERQVRVEGVVEHVSAEESDAYFAMRPRASQLGAWASPQSTAIADRAWLEAQYAACEARYGSVVPRPAHWGGMRVIPDRFEFWQGRPSRLHDRLEWLRAAGGWTIRRLAP